jgi:hypothetical protein
MYKDLNDKLNQYLVEVAMSNPLALPEMLARASVLRMALALMDSFMSDYDRHLKHFEEELQRLSERRKSND